MTPRLNRLRGQRVGIQDGLAHAGAVVIVAEAEEVVSRGGGVQFVAGGEAERHCVRGRGAVCVVKVGIGICGCPGSAWVVSW